MISLSLIRLAAAGDLLPQPPDARTVLAAVLVYQSRERTVLAAQTPPPRSILYFDLQMLYGSLEHVARVSPFPITYCGRLF